MPWAVSILLLALALLALAGACYWFAQTISVVRDMDHDAPPGDITRN